MKFACFALLLAAAGISSAGCNKSPVKLYPVTGKVLFKDQPAEGAQVVFHPLSETDAAESVVKASMPFGTVEADGTFKLYTDPYGQGAPPGDYSVLITWFAQGAGEQTVNKLSPKYSDHEKPLLKAKVTAGKNELPPFQLKS